MFRKKNILTIGIAVLSFSFFTSCEKYLDVEPRYVEDAENYFNNKGDYERALVGAYDLLQSSFIINWIGEIASDNSIAGGESVNDSEGLHQIDAMNHGGVNSELRNVFRWNYAGIARTNYIMEYKDKTAFTGKEIILGETRFLRAYYYFELVKFFGDVPLVVDKRLGAEEVTKIPRTPKAEVYQQIEEDLKYAIENLNWSNPIKGRTDKGAALALLGKVYLYQNKFDLAATTLDAVISANAFTLVSDFGSMYLASGENGPESVFEIQYSNVSPYYNWGGATRGQGNYAVQQCGIRGLNGSAQMPYAAGWSTNLPTQNLAAAYTAGDRRKNVTVLDIEAYKAANPSFNITYQVAPFKNTGLYNQKYLPRKGETSGQVELNYTNNFRIIRYADVLLMAAEAFNRATAPNDSKAQGYLNQVRQRAFGNASNNITATGTALRQAIWDERRLELAMEGDRFFDLVRTGQAASRITGFRVGKHEVFPIPQQEVDISGLTQNAGY